MRKKRPLTLTATHMLDKQGNKISIDPMKHQELSNKISAIIRTLETGIPHSVVS